MVESIGIYQSEPNSAKKAQEKKEAVFIVLAGARAYRRRRGEKLQGVTPKVVNVRA